jgi:integrase
MDDGSFAEKLLKRARLVDMDATPVTTTTSVSVFTRHSFDCLERKPKETDEQYTNRTAPTWKRCQCRKHIYIYEAGRVTYRSAKTRSWEQAEKFAASLRDAKDPVKIELARIKAEEEAKKKKEAAKDSSIEDALDQWIAHLKLKSYANRSAYATFRRVVLEWATSKKFKNLSDVTPDSLDAWIGGWSPEAKEEENRLKANTQKFRVAKIRAFFLWCYKLHKVATDPAAAIRNIVVTDDDMEPTMPLTPAQFEQVMKATYKDTEFGAEFRAIFLLQRWLGVRLIDALLLARSGVQGNRIRLTVQKTRNSTGATIDRQVPDAMVQALAAVVPRKSSRAETHPDRYFTTGKCGHRALSTMWTTRIRKLNEYLDLKNEDAIAGELGAPMQFRSHMLRDTFAVQHLLAGMKLQDVSRLLTHSSIRTTEQHYAKWSKERRDKLEEETMESMQRQGAVFAGD